MESKTLSSAVTSIVIVDDSSFIINRLERFFSERLHFNVVSRGRDGNEAVALYEKYRPHLITLDISMPNKRGNDAAREILEKYPDARILVISAVRGNEILECLSFGVKGYMEKPLQFENEEYIQEFLDSIYDIFPELKPAAGN